MAIRPFALVSSLALIAGASLPLIGADTPSTGAPEIGGGKQIIGPNGGTSEVGSGRSQAGGKQVVVQGLLDIDGVQQNNYHDGTSAVPDHLSAGWIRAEFGVRINVDERVEAVVTVAYQGTMGASTATSATNAPNNGQAGNAVIDDAFVRLKDFLSFRELSVDAGRMPVAWNLRRDHPAFLFDSHADNPTVTSWDGARAKWNYDTLDLSPYVFKLPDTSNLFGAVIDWEPENAGNNRIFVTGSANLQRYLLLKDGGLADKLETYYLGIDANLADFELYGEGALQHGKEFNSTTFAGWALTGGVDMHAFSDYFVIGLQGDYLSGDNNSTDQTNHAFINPNEGTSDTYIVENEKYGELSRMLDGNLASAKAKMEWALDDRKRIKIKSTYANYRIPKPQAGADKKFGQEVDIALAWGYTRNSTFTLFGGFFKPNYGYRDIVTTTSSAMDWIYTFGANVLVKF